MNYRCIYVNRAGLYALGNFNVDTGETVYAILNLPKGVFKARLRVIYQITSKLASSRIGNMISFACADSTNYILTFMSESLARITASSVYIFQELIQKT